MSNEPDDYSVDQSMHGSAPQISAQEERTWGALSHVAALVAMIFSAGFLGFLGSLLVYVLYKDRGPFVRAHAANSLNVQITMFIWLVGIVVIGGIFALVTLGVGLIVVVPLFLLAPFVAGVLHVVGAIKAHNGEWWTPPLTWRFVD